jgi:hypothetical protein
MQNELPGFEDLLERHRAEKAEAVRFAKKGLFVHDGTMLYADDVGAFLEAVKRPTPVPPRPDGHLEYCRKFFLGRGDNHVPNQRA